MTHPKPDNAPLIQEARICLHCGRTEVGWRYNRCPNCGEMADNAPTPTGPVLSVEQVDARFSQWLKYQCLVDHPVELYKQSHEALRALLAQRDKRVEELEKDRDRLDWLSTGAAKSICERPFNNHRWHILEAPTWTSIASGGTPRAAIDAAMKDPK